MHIGLFDSGVGGLTVLKEIRKLLPHSQFSYLGDTARLPYGNKAPETLRKYTQENIEFLDQLGVDAIVVACHSASSVVLEQKKSPKGTPLYNVITPSCEEALKRTNNNSIGVMATKATTSSEVYVKYISNLDSSAKVTSEACPLLVPLVEENLIDDEFTHLALNRYLTPLITQAVDSIILGCTHYPILETEIAKICGNSVQLINPAVSVAKQLASRASDSAKASKLSIYLTDHAPHFIDHARKLLGTELEIEFLPAHL